ncbi:MAG: type III-A CRISPR-associated protein Csm2 [Bacteroidetes bacterium]|nr:MAG: type III-A CRISPR-associated protein Csm2 [Bacteroidota bacterium]
MTMANQHYAHGGQRNPHHGGGKKDPEAERRQQLKRAFGDDYVTFILNPDKPDYNAYIEKLKAFVSRNVKGITTSQLRNAFSRIKPLKNPKELPPLRPNLAYVAARSNSDQMKLLMQLVDDLIPGVDSSEKLAEFQRFFEAVIAYHKYFGGKD